jgi:hypothetical protein
MHKKIHLAGLILVAVSLFATACSGAKATPTAAPTIDTNLIFTQAAQTVQAGQALTQAVKPPTQTAVPTQPIAPTFTMDPTMGAALTATADAVLKAGGSVPTATPGGILIPTATLGSGITPVVLPTATKAAGLPPTTSGDKCEWVSNVPSDNTKLTKSSSFDVTIKVKNSGTTTWTSKYALRYYAGERMGVPSDYYIQNDVKPNEVYAFQFEMKTPSSTGKKEVLIVIQNADGRNMCFINLPYEITD